MSFFEPIPDAPKQPAPQRRPPWIGAPENELGVGVPMRVLLARTDDIAVSVGDVVAYSTGFTLRLAVRVRPGVVEDPRSFFMQLHAPPGMASADGLRFGIGFADGRRATRMRPGPTSEGPPPIALMARGGGDSGGGGLDVGYWVFPLPPAGPLVFALEWPSRGIDETTREVDATAIAEAGAQSEVLWKDDRPFGEGGGFSASSTYVLQPNRPSGQV
jgi:hypothetical protein